MAKSAGYNGVEVARIGRLVVAHQRELKDFFGPSSVRATKVQVGRTHLSVSLNDGRSVRVPIAWFRCLASDRPSNDSSGG